jgi:mono/diheme cytochrome c family protein
MMITRINVGLLVLLGFSIGLKWVLTPDPSSPNPDPLTDMAVSVRSGSFGSTRHLPEGMTLREPVPGSIVRGRIPLHYGPTPEEAQRAGRELTNPYSTKDKAALERGGIVYASVCVPCHGPLGRGDGPVSTRGFPPPASLLTGRPVQHKDGTIFHVITYGYRNMPAHAPQVLPEDRWKVILHVRGLQQKAAAEEDDRRRAAQERRVTR